MDAYRFDEFVRSLPSTSSRRRLLAAVVVFAITSQATDARKKRKSKKKRRCRPGCPGGTCVDGVCRCSGDRVLCNGACVPGCIGEAIVNPVTCSCCQTGAECGPGLDCCSGICQPNTGGGADFCVARTLGSPCDFDAQCQTTVCPPAQCPLNQRPICRNAQCGCPDGTEACGGACVPPCTGGNVRIPGACACCRRNGEICFGVTPCCSHDCITGTTSSRCIGRPPGAECDFDEQCASNACTLNVCGD